MLNVFGVFIWKRTFISCSIIGMEIMDLRAQWQAEAQGKLFAHLRQDEFFHLAIDKEAGFRTKPTDFVAHVGNPAGEFGVD